jgi:hypothetical protein
MREVASTGIEWTDEDIDRMSLGEDMSGKYLRLKPIEEVTSMTIESFYKTFNNPQKTKCIDTPSKYWEN